MYWQKGRKNPAKVKQEASLRLGDIVNIAEGMTTSTLKKSGNEDKADLYLSLVGRGGQRTLDLEVSSTKERAQLVRGFRMLINGK